MLRPGREPIPSEDVLKVVADGGEDSVGGVAGAALEMAAVITVDGGAAAQLTLDDTEDTALLAGDEDPAGVRGIVAAISLVNIGALDLRPVSFWVSSMTVRNVCLDAARECLGVQHERGGLVLTRIVLLALGERRRRSSDRRDNGTTTEAADRFGRR